MRLATVSPSLIRNCYTAPQAQSITSIYAQPPDPADASLLLAEFALPSFIMDGTTIMAKANQ